MTSLQNTACPNCGWSESDEQGFNEYLEHLELQQDVPLPSRWKQMLRRFFRHDLLYLGFLYATNHVWMSAFWTSRGFTGLSSWRVFGTSFAMTAVSYTAFLLLEFLLDAAESRFERYRFEKQCSFTSAPAPEPVITTQGEQS